MHALPRQLAEHMQDEGGVAQYGEKTALQQHARAVSPAGRARAGGTRKDRDRRQKDTLRRTEIQLKKSKKIQQHGVRRRKRGGVLLAA